jgi:hypothetical protein
MPSGSETGLKQDQEQDLENLKTPIKKSEMFKQRV